MPEVIASDFPAIVVVARFLGDHWPMIIAVLNI